MPQLQPSALRLVTDERRRSRTRPPPRRTAGSWSLERIAGNQATARRLGALGVQARLKVNRPGDRWEQEADRVADRILSGGEATASAGAPAVQRMCKECEEEEQSPSGGVPPIQRRCADCEEELQRQPAAGGEREEVQAKQRPGRRPSLGPTSGSRIAALRGGGQPLPRSTRSFFEQRFGRDFGDVRIHHDAHAGELAASINARAFTLGRDVAFAPGEFDPGTRSGRHLLAHELTHTLQQGGDPAPRRIFRQEDPDAESPAGEAPPIEVPGTDLELIPGPLGPFLGNPRLLLPTRLRLRDASLSGGPTFVADISPRLLAGTLLGNLDLYTWTRPGTPVEDVDPETQARIALVNPRISFDPSAGTLRGRATLSVGSDYPPALKAPTELDVSFESSELGQFRGRLGFGPLEANISLRLRYQTGRLEHSLSPVFAPRGGFAGLWPRLQSILRDTVPGLRLGSASAALRSLYGTLRAGEIEAAEFATRTIALLAESIPPEADLDALRTALSDFADVVLHPGFSAGGSLRLFGVPLTGFSAEAATTQPLERPLPGAPAAFPISGLAGGVILAPPGSIKETAVPALGFTGFSFGERSGTAGTLAALPSLSTSAISRGEPLLNQFPVYAYGELSHVRRITDGLDLGVRVTLQISTPELFGSTEAPDDPAAALSQSILDFQEAQGGTPASAVPNLGVTVFGEFNAF